MSFLLYEYAWCTRIRAELFGGSVERSPQLTRPPLHVAGDVLEIGALHSVAVADFAAFDRYIAQLRTYYFDFASSLPASSQRSLLLGLHLLRLLSQQLIGDFHVALERLDSATLSSDPFVRFPIALEQHIMEGLDNQVVAAAQNAPHPSYAPFMEQLLQTLRYVDIEAPE